MRHVWLPHAGTRPPHMSFKFKPLKYILISFASRVHLFRNHYLFTVLILKPTTSVSSCNLVIPCRLLLDHFMSLFKLRLASPMSISISIRARTVSCELHSSVPRLLCQQGKSSWHQFRQSHKPRSNPIVILSMTIITRSCHISSCEITSALVATSDISTSVHYEIKSSTLVYLALSHPPYPTGSLSSLQLMRKNNKQKTIKLVWNHIIMMKFRSPHRRHTLPE